MAKQFVSLITINSYFNDFYYITILILNSFYILGKLIEHCFNIWTEDSFFISLD